MKIVAVTACPTGVAHTYMAAEQLAKTAKKLGHTIKVETQGSMGIENELSQADIDGADAAIIAADIAIEQPERFAGIRKVEVPVAADESIRRAGDPYRVRDLEAADVAVLKVQPLGGVRACLRIAEDIGLPVVVSSALETSVGIAAGLALAAALPELEHACGLATVQLLTGDVTPAPLLPRDGALPVVRPEVDDTLLARWAADPERTAAWRQRLAEVAAVGQDRSS